MLGVVLVHGFGSGPGTWRALEERVAEEPSLGFARTLPFSYATGLKRISPLKVFPSLNAAADSLREYLRTEAGGFDDLMLVTHSMGGLVVQRYLARMLADGHGRELARIRRVVMLACPNDGSELLLSLRRSVFGRRGHPQESELQPLNEQVAETRRAVVRDVVYANEVTDRSCPIPFSVYAGDSDAVVRLASARSVFPDAAALPGDHFSLLQATTARHRTFTTLRRLIRESGGACGAPDGGSDDDGSPSALSGPAPHEPAAVRESVAVREPAAGYEPAAPGQPAAPGRPLAEVTDPFALEVHRAVGSELLPARSDLPVLPVYVEREHDAQLRAVVDEAAGGTSAMTVLVGGSSTGKTRACWEALRRLPAGWRLWHPFDPTRPEAALADLERVAPRTVVWLNETQHYLQTATDMGERIAAGLRTLLSDQDRGPVLVLGTLWPDYWHTLTTPPDPAASEDPHAQARALLTGHGLSVPPCFGEDDLRTLAEQAAADPRLAYAAAHAEAGAITQYLAGAPVLLERYRTAKDGARVLIEAAMDARRLGHGPALLLPLLEDAAAGYLSDTRWDLLGDDWLEQALAYATQPLRGAHGPLTLIRPRTGQAAGPPRYRLADYLEQHARTHRRTVRPPAALWDAFARHAAPADLLTLGHAAYGRGLFRTAFGFYTRAGEAGEPSGPRWAASRLAQVGRLEEALVWFQRAADAGDRTAPLWTAERLAAAGRLDDALHWYARAADTAGAEAADGADGTEALRAAASQLVLAGRLEEALVWFQRAVDTGDTALVRRIGETYARSGRLEEALALAESTAEGGRTSALVWAADLLAEAGRWEEALAWYERAAGAGDDWALRCAGYELARAGRLEEALGWYERAAGAGDTEALRWAASRLAQAGRLEEALVWFARAAEAGGTEALRWAASRLAQAGRLEEALVWFARAAEAGDTSALGWAAGLLADAGRLEEALAWYERAAEAGDTSAVREAANRLGEAHRLEEALAWYERSAAAGSTEAMQWAGHLLAYTGRLAEALPWFERAVDAGDIQALNAAASRLAQAGRSEEALAWYHRAADAGSSEALREVVDLLARTGRAEESARLRRFGWQPDRTIATPWPA